MLFRDRSDAGRQLARALARRDLPAPILLALPRGGVPVALEIARENGWPVEVLVSRKLGVPWQPELGFGAVAEGGVRWLDRFIVREAGLTESMIEAATAEQRAEVERRVQRWRSGRALPDLQGRTAVLVDDGIATGGTMHAAVAAVRAASPARVVIAVPVAARENAETLGADVDDLVCLELTDELDGIGAWYLDFRQLSDGEVEELLRESRESAPPEGSARTVRIPADGEQLEGTLAVPPGAVGVVLFAHGSGSSRFSPRNQRVAQQLREAGLGTLLFDLLTSEEERLDRRTAELRFDVDMLGRRVRQAAEWLATQPEGRLPIGCFGSSTGAAAALIAAADRPDLVRAVVSRGGRPDLAGEALPRVDAPTLLLVGDLDYQVVDLNSEALERLRDGEMRLVPGATHLFEEPGTLDQVAEAAAAFFHHQLEQAGAGAGQRAGEEAHV